MIEATAAPKPLVSILTQVLNQSEWLREMIESVVASTYQDWELVLVDDGSTEDIKAVVESFADKRIRYFRFDENRGVPHGTNFALKMANGKYVCLLSADEVITKEKLADQVEYLESHPGVDCIWGLPGSGADGVNYPMGPRPEWEQYAMKAHNRSREAWLRTLLQLENVPIGGCSLMMRMEVMKTLGGMDEKLTLFSDHELYCRFFSRGYVGQILPYRWAIDKAPGPDTVRSRNQHRAQEEYRYVIEKHKLPFPPPKGTVTVGIPCHNHARYLKAAVDSVLAQTVPVHEILILDDCSTDNFKEVAAQFTDERIKLLAFDENRGMPEALNQMAYRANGDFFVALSADDTLAPTFVEKCLAKFSENCWLEFVASQTDFIDEYGEPYADQKHPFFTIPKATSKTREEWLQTLYNGNIYFGAGMYRTKVLSEVGGWEKRFKVISDYQLYLKLIHRGENLGIVEEPLTHTRIHGKNNSLLDKERAAELPWLYHYAKKPFYRKHMKVMIATPFYEVKAFSPYVVSLAATMRLLTAVGIEWGFQELSGDSYVHRARNTLCDVFLRDPDTTDLFFIDSDMSWDPQAFVNMLLLPDDIVGGTYPVKNAWEQWTSIPNVYTNAEGKGELRGRPLGEGNALIEARVLAGGFLRIKRHVLESFKQHYPDLKYKEPSTDPQNPDHEYAEFFFAGKIDGQFFGEDHSFSKRMREMGAKMYIYPNVDIVHWGYKDFRGNYKQFLDKQQGVEAMH